MVIIDILAVNVKIRLEKKQLKVQEEKEHILVKNSNNYDHHSGYLEKSGKNSNSLASQNNAGSQTLTDAIITTIIKKNTESGSSELDPNFLNPPLHSEDVGSHHAHSSMSQKLNYLMTRKHKLSQCRLRSLNNTEGESRIKSSYSAADNIGNIL